MYRMEARPAATRIMPTHFAALTTNGYLQNMIEESSQWGDAHTSRCPNDNGIPQNVLAWGAEGAIHMKPKDTNFCLPISFNHINKILSLWVIFLSRTALRIFLQQLRVFAPTIT